MSKKKLLKKLIQYETQKCKIISAIHKTNGYIIFDEEPSRCRKLNGYIILNNNKIIFFFRHTELYIANFSHIDEYGCVHVASKYSSFWLYGYFGEFDIDEYVKKRNEYLLSFECNKPPLVNDVNDIPKYIKSFHMFIDNRGGKLNN